MRNSRFYSCILLLALSLTCLCSGLIADARAASVPVLVKDIKTRIKDNSNIRNLTAAGTTLFFTAFDQAHGNELWKSNGTAAGTVMVKDIKPGSGDSYHDPNFSTYWNGFLYFEAYGPNGWSLWKSDGTAANTVEVSADVDPGDMVVFKNLLYFKGYGDGLWKSDGTTAGTVAVLGGIGSLDNLVVASATRLYFTIGNDLWTSDGTTAGTVVLQSDIYPTDLVSVSGTLYFNGWDATNGYRLWTSNGTVAGTVVVNYAADPSNLIEVNGALYFSANDPVAGASLVKLVPGGVPTVVKSSISPINPFNWNGVLYFYNGGDLWKSDGTLAGTVIVKADCYPSMMMNIGATLYFEGWDNLHGYELWRSDGTTAGTFMVKDINPGTANSSIEQLTNVNGTLFLRATEAATGAQLWMSNGTDAGTVRVQNLSPGSEDASPDKFLDVNGTLYFSADDYDNGRKLWQSNGTAVGTSMVPGLTGSSPVPLANVGGTLYFAANSDDLWKRVGSSDATLVKAGVTTNDPSLVSYINGILYFRGWDSIHGWELWKSDGTDAGTVMVKDIKTGTNNSDVRKIVKLGTTLYFIANADTTNNGQLWKSDGTDAGTVRVSTAIKNAENLTVVNGKLFFHGDDASNTNALWVSDGTEGGTTVLMNNIYPEYLTTAGNTLFFEGWTSPLGYELWKSDGTVAGTINLKNINPTGSANPRNLTNVNGTLYFSVWNTWNAPSHDQLWKSDGTPAGTVLVKDMPADYGYTSIESLTSVHGVLTFVFQDKSWATTHDDSAELWMSDGTAAGTVKVKDIFTGDYGSAPANLTMANTPPNGIDKQALFFSAIDPIAGRELFILDFTPPVSAITSPVNNAYLRGTSFVISGSTSDSMPGSGVTTILVSTDNGFNWYSATYTPDASSWSYAWNNPADGVYTIKSLAFDRATNAQDPAASITVTVDNTLPAVTFAMPAVYHNSKTVPITTFTATDTNGINAYCLTSTNSSSGCVWNALKPTSVTFASEGVNTVYVWAKDPAGNVSAQHGATVTVSLPHTLNINVPGAGDGGGSVTYVQKSQAFSTNYTTTVYSFDPIKLQATPFQYSVFGGWTGFCAGTGECNYTIPTVAAGGSTQTATATFNFDSAHAVFVSPNYYTSILGAYDNPATINGSDIRMWGVNFPDVLLLDGNKEVTLVGGDNQAHNAYTGVMTTVPGPMTIKNGSVTIENMAIK